MKKFFSSTPGAIITISLYAAFWYWFTKSFFMVFCSLLITGFFYATDFTRKKLQRNPKYIHFKLFPKKLSTKKQAIIIQHFSFYRRLKPDLQANFDHRVACFLKRYKIVGRQGFFVNEDCKIMIAACYTQLTFGMNTYLSDAFKTVLIYPDFYYSNITHKEHFGEYNPRMKLVVLSWKNFYEGIKFDTNNYNLGIHEFSHAILHSSKKKKAYAQTVAESEFDKGFQKIRILLSNVDEMNLIIHSEYFRDYAFTNVDEFISVLLEHFFETPKEFKSRFPELFDIVKNMIHYREEWFK